jgi:hypothetical protein
MKRIVNFFFKKKEIVLDCFTYAPHVYDYAKIDRASNYIPQWWKDTPSATPGSNGKLATIKHCIGLIDFFREGIVIPSWFEMELNIHEFASQNRELYHWDASSSIVKTDNSHHSEQFYGFAGEAGHNMKITSPWAFRTKEFVNFTWTQPTWNNRSFISNLQILPAVINFKYQHATEINYFLLIKKEKQEVTVPPLTPLVIMHPLTDQNIIIKNHLVSKDEWMRYYGTGQLFLQRNASDSGKHYKHKKHLIDQFDKLKKCPFHKG